MDPVRILFVCLGNICRSPTAEGVLLKLVADKGRAAAFEIDSAGTGNWHAGEAPDHRTIAHAKRRGYDLSTLRARQVQGEDFANFDWILAMDRNNLAGLQKWCTPGMRARVELMGHFHSSGRAPEVPDPYAGGPEGFELVLDMIEDACGRFLEQLPPQ